MSVTVARHPPRGRPRDPRRREAILDAAIALVAEVGYDRMTVDALAARAGVSKPTIYRRWPGGKAEIVVEAIRAQARRRPARCPTPAACAATCWRCSARVVDGLDAHVAGGLISQLRASAELAALFRDEVVADERAPLRVLLDRARRARRDRRRRRHAAVRRHRRLGHLHPRH